MSTDRELLELAAKAAGYTLRWVETFDALLRGSSPMPYIVPDWPENRRKRIDDCKLWGPLTDDGDALRLAVKLRIAIDFNWSGQVFVGWNGTNDCSGARNHSNNELCEQYGADPYAATRRAIVRAAAELGRKS